MNVWEQSSAYVFQVDMMYSSISDAEYGINVRPVGIYVATVSRLRTFENDASSPSPESSRCTTLNVLFKTSLPHCRVNYHCFRL